MSKGYEQTHPVAPKRYIWYASIIFMLVPCQRRGVYYVRFTDPITEKRLSAISTGKTSRDDALMVVAGWLKEGVHQKHVEQKVQFRLTI
jgi:hypothetical protein